MMQPIKITIATIVFADSLAVRVGCLCGHSLFDWERRIAPSENGSKNKDHIDDRPWQPSLTEQRPLPLTSFSDKNKGSKEVSHGP